MMPPEAAAFEDVGSVPGTVWDDFASSAAGGYLLTAGAGGITRFMGSRSRFDAEASVEKLHA